MSLEFICRCEIFEFKDIDIPRTDNPGIAQTYNLKKKFIKFFKGNAGKYEIPKKAKTISFPNFRKYNGHINYGEPYFTFE